MNYAEQHLLRWLQDRPLINIRLLERESGVPEGTIQHSISERRALPAKHFKSISKILTDYGFTPLTGE